MSEEENHQFEKIKQLINAALSLNDAEEYEKAKEIGLLALELDPEFSTIHVLLGLSHQGLGQNSEAESYFRKAIELDEYNENALQSLGLLLLSRDKKEEGVDYLLKYLKLNNWEDTDNVRIVVDTLDKLNRQVEAMELLKDCWENKKQPEISEDLFLRLLVFGTKDDAFIVLKEAAEISGESGEYFNLATHEMLFNRYHDAINSLEMAFSLEAELGLAEPGFSYEEYLDAGETWPEYWPDEEKLSTYEYFIANCYLHLNEGEKALAAINRSIEIIRYKDPSDYSIKAKALISLCRYDEAIEAAEIGINSLDDDMDDLRINLHQSLATSHENLGQTDAAITIYNELIERYPDNISLYIFLMTIYLSQNNIEKVIILLGDGLRKGIVKSIPDTTLFKVYLVNFHKSGKKEIPNEILNSLVDNVSEDAGEEIINFLSMIIRNFDYQIINDVSWYFYNRFSKNSIIANVYAIANSLNKKYLDSISILDNAIENSKSNYEIKALLNNKAYNQILLGLFQDAEETIEKLLSINVDTESTDRSLLQCISFYIDQKIVNKRELSYRALKSEISAKINLATIYLIEENHENAISFALEIIDENCADSLGFELLGYCFMAINEDRLARPTLARAIKKINPDLENRIKYIQRTIDQIGIK